MNDLVIKISKMMCEATCPSGVVCNCTKYPYFNESSATILAEATKLVAARLIEEVDKISNDPRSH